MSAAEAMGPASLPAASLQIHEELWHVREDLRGVLEWATLASIWLISLGGLALAYVFTPRGSYVGGFVDVAGLLDLVLGGFAFVGTSVWVLLRSRRTDRNVEDWVEGMLPFLYQVKFELLPYAGPDREHDIWARFKSIYRDLAEADSPSLDARFARRLGTRALRFHEEVKGRKARHTFDLYASVGQERGLFVRRFAQAAPVTRAQLENLKSEVEDRVKRSAQDSCVVAAVAVGGFEPGAVTYAQSDEGCIMGDFPMDLIQETETGYRIVSVESG